MAEAIFSAVVGDMVGRVISLLASKFKGASSADAKVRRICYMLIKIHSVVEEAKARHITNRGTLQWLSELNDSLYQGQYLLDTAGCREEEVEDARGDQVLPPESFFSPSMFSPAKRMRVAACTVKSLLCRQNNGVGEIDKVLESLETVSGDLREFIMLLQSCEQIDRPLATNIFIDGPMFGRHVEKERIINFLLLDNGQPTGRLGVLPIVGDAGVGKTTLAQHACDDARVRNHFPLIIYTNFRYTLAMAQGKAKVVLASKHVVGDAENLIESLHVLKKNYRSKRFLVVFEDVDMRKKQTLQVLLPILRQGKQGSKIILTTTNRGIASIGTVEPIRLKVMPHPEYWFFFKGHAFPGRDVEENPRLVAAGKAISRKLNGSFFGAKIVGGVLRANPSPQFWCKVLGSNIGGLSLLGDGIGYIADLAENLLPSNADICEVTISKTPFFFSTEMARVEDLCQPTGGAFSHQGYMGVRFARVLLCRTVLPFQCLYHTAHCAVREADSSYESIRTAGGRFSHMAGLQLSEKQPELVRSEKGIVAEPFGKGAFGRLVEL